MTDLQGDGPCDDCGTLDNVIWYTDSVFWNAVIRKGEYIEPILCIPCFARRTDRRGYRPTGWRLVPEFHWENEKEWQARKAAPSRNGVRPCKWMHLSFYSWCSEHKAFLDETTQDPMLCRVITEVDHE